MSVLAPEEFSVRRAFWVDSEFVRVSWRPLRVLLRGDRLAPWAVPAFKPRSASELLLPIMLASTLRRWLPAVYWHA